MRARAAFVCALALPVMGLSACTGGDNSVSPTPASPTPTVSASAPALTTAPDSSLEPSTSPTPGSGAAGLPDGVIAVIPKIEAVDVDPGLGELRVYAVVPGISEDGGTCTLTLTSGSDRFEVDSDGIFNVDRTECPTAVLPLDDVGAGAWTAIITYTSGLAQGSSAPRTVDVP